MPTWSYVHANYRHEFELFVHVTDDTYVPQPTANPTPKPQNPLHLKIYENKLFSYILKVVH